MELEAAVDEYRRAAVALAEEAACWARQMARIKDHGDILTLERHNE